MWILAPSFREHENPLAVVVDLFPIRSGSRHTNYAIEGTDNAPVPAHLAGLSLDQLGDQ